MAGESEHLLTKYDATYSQSVRGPVCYSRDHVFFREKKVWTLTVG